MFQLFSLVIATVVASLIVFGLLWFLRDVARSLFDTPGCQIHGNSQCSCLSLSVPFMIRSETTFIENCDSKPVGVSWH